jgi:hypothetical protein
MIAVQSMQNPRKESTFGKWYSLPAIEGEVARNQVLSRVAIEGLGFTPWRMALARNPYERFEAFMDTFVWWVVGMGLPILIQAPLSRWYDKRIAKKYNLANPSLLKVGLEKLDRSYLAQASIRIAITKELGIKQVKYLPKVVNALILGKLLMIFIDLACMSAKQQLYFWGRNALTASLAKKKGFSGEFNIATSHQLAANAKAIESSEQTRKKISKMSGLMYPLILPLVLLGLMKSKAKIGQGVLGALKKMIPHFNYHNTIYMSKWVVFWNCLLGWNLTGFLAARDKHEQREQLTRCAVVDFFYFIGDDIFAGIAGKIFQNRYGIPIGRNLDNIVADAQKTGQKRVLEIANRLGRWNFRIGLFTTAMFLGVGITLVNNWFTQRKVLEEQAKMRNPLNAPNRL